MASAQSLQAVLGYRKFADVMVRVLLLDSGYHLQSECRRALQSLGHRVTVVSVLPTDRATDVVHKVLTAAIQCRPDCVLSINHLGFDAHGSLGGLLDQLQMPVAVWYVDNPFFVLRQAPALAPNMTSVFVWERTYAPLLRTAGMQDVHVLPLATDAAAMVGPPATPVPGRVAFVGNSMQAEVHKWQSRVPAAARDAATALRDALPHNRHALVSALQQHLRDPAAADWLAWSVFAATATHRAAVLRSLCPLPLSLWGDAGWQTELPAAAFQGPVTYGPALAQVYRCATVNVNVTSLQMPTAVNQRVFDGPAAGALMISDAQADVLEYFPPSDVVTFQTPAELLDKCRFYVDHPEQAAALVARARLRVLREHTYERRLQSLLDVLRTRHGRSQAAAARRMRM